MKQKKMTRVALIIGIISLILILINFSVYIVDINKSKYIEVSQKEIIENVFNGKIEVFCNVPSTGFCYSGMYGNCDGQVTYEPRSNSVDSYKSNDLIFRGNGECLLKYTERGLKFTLFGRTP